MFLGNGNGNGNGIPRQQDNESGTCHEAGNDGTDDEHSVNNDVADDWRKQLCQQADSYDHERHGSGHKSGVVIFVPVTPSTTSSLTILSS